MAAEVIYPTVGMVLCNHDDVDYKKACFDAYNRWIAEYCSAVPDRLLGCGQTALRSVDEGIADLETAGFAALGGKRAVLRLALDHLARHGNVETDPVPLPAGSPFGRINVDKEACTLCMACVSVCPAAALEAGGDTPKLSFIEWNCVQCGMCETGCPEDAIGLEPRFLFEHDARMRSRVLNEEEPFACIRGGKPFATRSVMDRMSERLRDHPMFQKPGSLERLQMCDDCRVKDMFVAEGGLGGFEEQR